MKRRGRILIIASVITGCAVALGIVVFPAAAPKGEAPSGMTSAVVGDHGVSLTIGGIQVRGPADVAPAGTVLTASWLSEPPGEPATRFALTAGQGISLHLDGKQPARPLTLTMPVFGDPPPGAVGVLITKPSGAADTQLIPGVYSQTLRTVTADITHLSDFWSGFFDFGKLGATVGKFLSQTVGISSPRPDCAGKPATSPDGTAITFDGDYSPQSTPIAWPCVRVEKDTAVVTLASNSPLPWRIRAAPAAVLDPQGTVDSSKALVLAGYSALVHKRPYAEGLLIPGTSMIYRFSLAKLPGTVAGRVDLGTYLAMALLFGLHEAIDVFGAPIPSLDKITDKTDAIQCFGDAVEAADIGTRPSVEAMVKLAKSVLSCFKMATEALTGHNLPGPVSVVLGIIESGIGLLVGGVQGAVLTATQSDNFTIRLNASKQQPANTRVVNVVAVNRSKEPLPGYTIQPGYSGVESCDPSPAAVGKDIVSCSPSAAGADICWVQTDRTTLLCGDMPWKKSLQRVTSTMPIGQITAPVDPDPWGLELSDGAKCRLRNGGSWDGRSDGMVGAYLCDRDKEFVLARQDSTSVINKSRPLWTVQVGDLGPGDAVFPPPKTVGVVTAYFAGSP